MGREPISQPPGNDSLHCPVRPRSAPMNIMDDRISRISFSETSEVLSAEASVQTTFPSRRQEQPSAVRNHQGCLAKGGTETLVLQLIEPAKQQQASRLKGRMAVYKLKEFLDGRGIQQLGILEVWRQ